jgi:hypothetical protein
VRPVWQQKVTRRLARAGASARVQIARDEIARIRDLTRTIDQLHQLVSQAAPQLLAERGMGVLIAKLIGEIAGAQRFTSDAQLARLAACAPIPVSSGQTNRHRLDRGGNRQLNHAIHMLAITKIIHDPQTALYIHKQRSRGKTNREAIRALKRHLVRRVYRLLTTPEQVPITLCTDRSLRGNVTVAARCAFRARTRGSDPCATRSSDGCAALSLANALPAGDDGEQAMDEPPRGRRAIPARAGGVPVRCRSSAFAMHVGGSAAFA